VGLLSWMCGVKAHTGIRMENTRLREPPIKRLPHAHPGQAMPLTATHYTPCLRFVSGGG
jgi:hypothetical protein